jgi:D-aminopeptidase
LDGVREPHLVGAAVDKLLNPWRSDNNPGVAVGVTIAGELMCAQVVGRTRVHGEIHLSSNTPMRMGSITKHFTCLTFLQLCDEGRASVDDPISKYLPTIHPISGVATARQLMSNTSGIADALDIHWQLCGFSARIDSEQVLDLYKRLDMRIHAPGTSWTYNNGGFFLVGAAIERIAGTSLESALQERIFARAGMANTRLCRFNSDLPGDAAFPHVRDSAGAFQPSDFGTVSGGEGGVISSLTDMLEWLSQWGLPALGGAHTWQAMVSPNVLTNGVLTGYGLGLMIGEEHGHCVVHHPGGVLGGSAHILKVPSLRLDLVALSNREDVSASSLAYSVLDFCIAKEKQKTREGSGVYPIGTYISPASGTVIKFLDPPYPDRPSESVVLIDGLELLMTIGSDGLLRPRRELHHQRLEIVPGEHEDSVILRRFGRSDTLLLARSAEADERQAVLGCYKSHSLGVEATIRASQGSLELEFRGPLGGMVYDLEALSKGVWRAVARSQKGGALGGVLKFVEHGSRFIYSTWQTKLLQFSRRS